MGGGFERTPGKGALEPGGSTKASTPGVGKRTLTEQLAPVQRSGPSPAQSLVGSDADAVQQAATRGTAGAGSALPYRETIQRLFGRHDVSGVQAHVGEEAATASRAIGAEAYATGNHVAFAGSPSLHTAAHEAAHVVQQRGGVQLKGGVGEAGDAYEQHADQVADAVVEGKSAEGLLDKYAGGSSATAPSPAMTRGGGAAASVQRQPAGGAPAGGAVANQHDSDPSPQPAEPPSRHVTWDQVSAAADDVTAQENLDIEWIGSLPDHLSESIDVAFADKPADVQVARTAAPGMAKIDSEITAAKRALAQTTKKRLTAEHKRATDKDVASDPTYVAERDLLEEEHIRRKQEYLKQTRETHDAAVAMKQPQQSVARPGTAKVKRLEGKALARTNFMSWAVDIFGSAEAAKTHFLGIKQVKGHPGMWLAAAPRARFESAQADFEAHHRGYTFVDTSVASDLRGMHQQRWGIGMLGHAIGESFDLKAIDNPNIKIDDVGHSHAYQIAKFGGDQGKRGSGRATMSIAERDVERTGQETAAGRNTPEGAALIESVRRQFAEMSTTSERLKASMAGGMAQLQAARDLYFEQAGLRVELAKAKADLAHADVVANKQLAGQKFDDAGARSAAIAQVKQDLGAAVDEKKEALKQSEAAVKQALDTAFAAWTASIQADIDKDQMSLDQNATSRAAMTADEQTLAAIDVNAEDAKTQLNQFAIDHALTTLDKMKRAPKDAKAYKQALGSELKTRDAKDAKKFASHDSDAHADIKELQFYQKKLMDPAFVFGAGEKHTDGHWGSTYDVSKVPLMQLLEHGTVLDDPMPEPDTGGPRKGVYNGEVVATLAKFGFAPGANYGDTMHFDFIEGFNKAVPGGRGAPNMKRTRYSPEGDVPPPAPAPGHKDQTEK